jgi:hypothetical protein
MDSLQQAFGINGSTGKPLHLRPNCSAYIIAATWSERVSERCVRNVWSCEACGFEFETAAYLPTFGMPEPTPVEAIVGADTGPSAPTEAESNQLVTDIKFL